jgi:lysyl-tRNA synthetase class I
LVPVGKTVPEIEAKLNVAVNWIRKLEDLNKRLRERLCRNEAEADMADKALRNTITRLENQVTELEAENNRLHEQLKIAELWKPL